MTGRDNASLGWTDEPILQAYKLDGRLLWRINLGKNIRDGPHYTQFMVYDLDGDARQSWHVSPLMELWMARAM